MITEYYFCKGTGRLWTVAVRLCSTPLSGSLSLACGVSITQKYVGKQYPREHALLALSRTRFEQCLCLLEVWRLKPLREPALGRRQQVVGFSALSLLLPQVRQ